MSSRPIMRHYQDNNNNNSKNDHLTRSFTHSLFGGSSLSLEFCIVAIGKQAHPFHRSLHIHLAKVALGRLGRLKGPVQKSQDGRIFQSAPLSKQISFCS